jgi:hypothetical protein
MIKNIISKSYVFKYYARFFFDFLIFFTKSRLDLY